MRIQFNCELLKNIYCFERRGRGKISETSLTKTKKKKENDEIELKMPSHTAEHINNEYGFICAIN